ncbi:hypothetical protein CQJ94_11360 [Glycomyces fuscus]|nr:hypothetical protein CQJ94_11360 [Glycomyces fuscus]
MSKDGFRVAMSATHSHLHFLTASIASLRRHNRRTEVTAHVDRPPAPVVDALKGLDVSLVGSGTPDASGPPEGRCEFTASRIAKLRAITTGEDTRRLYVDSDTVFLNDPAVLDKDLGHQVGRTADVFMLLRRPHAFTLWGDRSNYFRDPHITRTRALDLVNATFSLKGELKDLDELTGWNSGVVYGSGEALRAIGERWSRLYRETLTPSALEHIIPRDQLSLWLTLWEFGSDVRVGELPDAWNFMVGHFRGVTSGSEVMPEGATSGASIVHFAQNKNDPWALRMVASELRAIGAGPLAHQGIEHG